MPTALERPGAFAIVARCHRPARLGRGHAPTFANTLMAFERCGRLLDRLATAVTRARPGPLWLACMIGALAGSAVLPGSYPEEVYKSTDPGMWCIPIVLHRPRRRKSPYRSPRRIRARMEQACGK
jgi:hypothetical protein